jgi:hypothetical protein
VKIGRKIWVALKMTRQYFTDRTMGGRAPVADGYGMCLAVLNILYQNI